MAELITGGAGFIGCNLADRLLKQGKEVVVLDNFSRKGTRNNFNWLRKNHPDVKLVEADITKDFDELKRAVGGVDNVYHLAAQVAVTTSVVRPRLDFEINALGTFNVLEAVRQANPDAFVLFSSTNKVYGALEHEPVVMKGKRYEFKRLKKGVSEKMNLDFHSPYGCSKGTADQYVRDYSRIYDLKTVVFRQSCIYGTHQFGIEDQGWVAWFTIAAVLGKPITVYGDGMQVRDVLFVEDLVNAYDLSIGRIKLAAGQIYNVGGGAKITLSLLELLDLLEKKLSRKIPFTFADWRPGDQPVYISNIAKVGKDLNWKPQVKFDKGLERLILWIRSEEKTLRTLN